jgi:hypothetical protein
VSICIMSVKVHKGAALHCPWVKKSSSMSLLSFLCPPPQPFTDSLSCRLRASMRTRGFS